MNNEKIETYKKDFSIFVKHFLLKQPNKVQIKEDSAIIKEMKTLYPWQEVLLDNMSDEIIESLKREYHPDEFRTQYMLNPFQIGKTFKNTKRENRKERCGECSFFGDKGCTTSYLEAKHGNKNTPACSEFSPMILGTKATMIIIDDPIKKGEEIKTSSPFSY